VHALLGQNEGIGVVDLLTDRHPVVGSGQGCIVLSIHKGW